MTSQTWSIIYILYISCNHVWSVLWRDECAFNIPSSPNSVGTTWKGSGHVEPLAFRLRVEPIISITCNHHIMEDQGFLPIWCRYTVKWAARVQVTILGMKQYLLCCWMMPNRVCLRWLGLPFHSHQVHWPGSMIGHWATELRGAARSLATARVSCTWMAPVVRFVLQKTLMCAYVYACITCACI